VHALRRGSSRPGPGSDVVEMKFGLAENFERLVGLPVAEQYERRVMLVRRAEELGFYGYHVSEHHNNPLSLAPSPLVYLSALAQRTSRIKLGPLVLVLPCYLPFRLLEEICMVDQLSRGRLVVGVGRGVREVEHEWMAGDGDSHARFAETLAILRGGLGSSRLRHDGELFGFDLDIRFEPYQRPHPPLWYAGNLASAAELGMSVVGVPWRGMDRQQIDAYWEAFETDRASESPKWTEKPLLGSTRHIVVAETDSEAVRIARRAWPVHNANVWTIPFGPAASRQVTGMNVGEDFEVVLPRRRALLAGSAETVADALAEFVDQAGPGHNYLVANVQWGDIVHDEAMQSLELYATAVLPKLSSAKAVAWPEPAIV
jgi:alkanesulfonate monooxygenase SsuD/methylene tetrahydromethanopterin reductase-like flavin-dependent oxidoreductase (luciferase family)